ncbi:PadR family transcriptional regulator [Halobacillus salinus]|uniref:PadR family transcriptional regulator n=1 Tax=Halobacillus salinus TaxID=192814 RepID=A0A4Z0H180_9BACI|nr:PadR family transcriptional regulator [Halobacillus salinus]TGB03607.1 PadR family transcriptional regulator [Halobacillus salinus]
MEERLKNLKRSMDKLEFRTLQFSGNLREEIEKKLDQEEEGEEEVLVSIFQLLTQEKTGYTLSKSLRARGLVKFEDYEGRLYTILHRLEQKRYIKSGWREDGGKYYGLTKKGNKLLKNYERSSDRPSAISALVEVLEP